MSGFKLKSRISSDQKGCGNSPPTKGSSASSDIGPQPMRQFWHCGVFGSNRPEAPLVMPLVHWLYLAADIALGLILREGKYAQRTNYYIDSPNRIFLT
jgi:hypothetical protein